MLLSFWMNLYLIFLFLSICFIDYSFNSNLLYVIYILLGIIPLLIIAIKKKFEIPFFNMFLNFCLAMFFFTSILFTTIIIKNGIKFSLIEDIKAFLVFLSFYLIPFFITSILKLLKLLINKRNKIVHIIINITCIINIIFAIHFYYICYVFVQATE